MNFSDSDIVASITAQQGFVFTNQYLEADLVSSTHVPFGIKLNRRFRNRLLFFNQQKIKQPDLTVGILGCIAERLKRQLLEEEKVDLVAGPDAY